MFSVNRILRLVIPELWYNSLQAWFMRGPMKRLRSAHSRKMIARQEIYVQTLKAKVERGEKIQAAFISYRNACWQYDGVFRLMLQDERFDPYILVAPFCTTSTFTSTSTVEPDNKITGKEIRLDPAPGMDAIVGTFEQLGYPLVDSRQGMKPGKFLDINKTGRRPDLLFHPDCWNNAYPLRQFGLDHFLDQANVYVPYAIMNMGLHDIHFNRDFHLQVWRNFYESFVHKQLADRYSDNSGANAIFSGYPKLDPFFDQGYRPLDVWKPQEKPKKRIIWAPHHFMLDGDMSSNFLFVHDQMLALAHKYRDVAQFAFKPHPLLPYKLDLIPQWGATRRKHYFEEWCNLSNGQLETGQYIDLFLTSDGMVQDCGSFTCEYPCTGKPMLFMHANEHSTNAWNELARAMLSHLYQCKKACGVEEFIEKVILGGNDTMRQERLEFVQANFHPPAGAHSASEFIFKYITHAIGI